MHNKKKPSPPVKKTKTVVKEQNNNKYIGLNKIDLRFTFPILLISFLCYLPSLNADFINWDDPTNLLENEYIRNLSSHNILAFFSEPIQYMYTPMVYLTWAIEYSIAGYNPFIYHFTNVIMHLINIVLLIVLVRTLLPQSIYAPIIVGALFALHPLNVEGVAWVTERINVLMALFVFITLIMYIKYTLTSQKKYYLLTLLFFIIACLSKSSVVVIPFILLLIDWFNNRTLNRNALAEKIPFFAISLIIGIITIQTRQDIGNISLPFNYNLFDRLLIAFFSIVIYPIKAIIPYKLSIAYAWPNNNLGHMPFIFYLSPIILGILTWFILYFGKKHKIIIFGALFYLITLSINLIALAQDNFMSDRYAYIILIGLFLPIAYYIDRYTINKKYFFNIVMILFITHTGIMSLITHKRSYAWKNSYTIFSDAIKKEPNVSWIYNTLGVWKLNNNDITGALNDISKSIELYPHYYQAHYNLGNVYKTNNDFEKAIHCYSKAIEIVPNYYEALQNRALVFSRINKFEEAINDINIVIINKPSAGAYNIRGAAYFALNKIEKAIADFSVALNLLPQDIEMLKNRSLAWFTIGNIENACIDMKKAFHLSNEEAYNNFIKENCK